MFRWCLVCLVSVLMAKLTVSQGYIMRDDLAIDSLLSIVQNMKYVSFSEKNLSQL